MSAQYIKDHVQKAQDRLLTQFKGRPNITAVIGMLAQAVQDFEDTAFPVSSGRYLDNALGAQLDRLGELIGLNRGGLDDAQFKALLLATIASNNSKADNETLLRLIQSVFQAKAGRVVSPFSPGHASRHAPAAVAFEIGQPGIAKGLYPLVLTLIKNSIGAGISLSWVSTYDGDKAFALAGPQPGLGFAGNDASGGGKLASLILNNLAN